MGIRLKVLYKRDKEYFKEYILTYKDSIQICTENEVENKERSFVITKKEKSLFSKKTTENLGKMDWKLKIDQENRLYLRILKVADIKIEWLRYDEIMILQDPFHNEIENPSKFILKHPSGEHTELILKVEEYFLEEAPELKEFYKLTKRFMSHCNSFYCIYYGMKDDLEFAVKTPMRRAYTDVVDEQYRYEKAMELLDNISEHASIPPIVEYSTHGNMAFMITPWVGGKSLLWWQNKKEHTFSLREIFGIVRQIVDLICHLNLNNVVHRGITPSNILIDKDNESLYLVGFGLAKQFDEQHHTESYQSSITNLNQQEKSQEFLKFMPPEFFHPEMQCDIRWDIYSVGVLIYYLLFSHGPYEEKSSHYNAIGSNHYKELFEKKILPMSITKTVDLLSKETVEDKKNKVLETMYSLSPKLIEILDSIFMKCCNPNINKRYQDPLELKAHLESFIQKWMIHQIRYGRTQDLELAILVQAYQSGDLAQEKYLEILNNYKDSPIEFAYSNKIINEKQKNILPKRKIAPLNLVAYSHTHNNFSLYREVKEKRQKIQFKLLQKNLSKKELLEQQNNKIISDNKNLLDAISGRFSVGMKLPGKKNNQYILKKCIGEGGMGTVYKALSIKTRDYVAIKIFNWDFDHLKNSDYIQAFIRFIIEAYAIYNMNHKNIIKTIDIDNIGLKYYIMEYIEGEDLESWLDKQNRTDPQFILDIIIQVTEGLLYIHDKDIIHRDIKLANIMILKDKQQIKILDFGIIQNLPWYIHNQKKYFLGTPRYAAPETLLGESPTKQSDIYSMGIVFYELLTKEFPLKDENYHKIVLYHSQKKSIDLEKIFIINPEIPRSYSHILKKMLSYSLRERYQNCDQLITDLKKLKNEKDLF